LAGTNLPAAAFGRWAAGRIAGYIVLSRQYFVRQAAALLQFARETTNPQLAAGLMPNPKCSGTAHQPVGPTSPASWRFVRSRPGSRPPMPTKQSTRRRSHFTGARKQPETQTGYQYPLVNNGVRSCGTSSSA